MRKIPHALTRRARSQRAQRRLRPAAERGVALILTLLLLGLMSILGLSMVLYFSSDMMINGYYRNYRGAYYAADSGLNIARQTLVNRVLADLPATVNIGTSPMPPNEDAAARSAVLSAYGASYTSLNSGQAAQSWPESFLVNSATFACAIGCSPTLVTAWDASTPPKATGYQYVFNYTLSTTGKASGFEQTVVTENGSLIFNAVLSPAGGSKFSFAAYGMFFDKSNICDGSYLVPGTITGPVFTNGAWNFGTAGAYIFTDQVGQVGANTGFQFSGACNQMPAASATNGSQTIAPTFQSSFKQGQSAIPLPSDSFSQKRAVLDGLGTNVSAPTNADLSAVLKDISGVAYPGSGATSGVYLPYSLSSGVNTVSGGGIYVEGDSQAKLSIGTSGLGNPTQIFTITQGAAVTTITIDTTANTTIVQSGATVLNLAGVPKNLNNNKPATLLYANGSITALSGPGQGVPAVQNGAAITITAKNDVTITGDILYKAEPVTFTQNQIPGTPPDTLIPANDHDQTLGIFTANGNINLNNGQANRNLEIDASLATISTGGLGGVQNLGAHINTLNIVGGRIQSQGKNINASTRNVFFDRRYTSRPGFAPPWFPSTSIAPPGLNSTSTTASVQRVSWNTTPQ